MNQHYIPTSLSIHKNNYHKTFDKTIIHRWTAEQIFMFLLLQYSFFSTSAPTAIVMAVGAEGF